MDTNKKVDWLIIAIGIVMILVNTLKIYGLFSAYKGMNWTSWLLPLSTLFLGVVKLKEDSKKSKRIFGKE